MWIKLSRFREYSLEGRILAALENNDIFSHLYMFGVLYMFLIGENKYQGRKIEDTFFFKWFPVSSLPLRGSLNKNTTVHSFVTNFSQNNLQNLFNWNVLLSLLKLGGKNNQKSQELFST